MAAAGKRRAARRAPEPAPAPQARDAQGHPLCALCGRPIPPHARQSLHHLTPKLKGGARGPVVRLHQICHNEIHAALSEAELARDHATPEALRAHPRLARFIAWVADKDPAFHAPSLGGRRPRGGRRGRGAG